MEGRPHDPHFIGRNQAKVELSSGNSACVQKNDSKRNNTLWLIANSFNICGVAFKLNKNQRQQRLHDLQKRWRKVSSVRCSTKQLQIWFLLCLFIFFTNLFVDKKKQKLKGQKKSKTKVWICPLVVLQSGKREPWWLLRICICCKISVSQRNKLGLFKPTGSCDSALCSLQKIFCLKIWFMTEKAHCGEEVISHFL